MSEAGSMTNPRRLTGADSTHPLLSLVDEMVPARDAVVSLFWNLYKACLVGNQAPVVTALWERIQRPKVGDWVTTLDSRGRDLDTRIKGFGIYLGNIGDAVFIQYGQDSHDVCRWTNCTLYAIPGLTPAASPGEES